MSASADLFAEPAAPAPRRERLREGAFVLRGFALAAGPALLDVLAAVLARAPLRHMVTPGGRRMSVAMTNCGALGWISDPSGYRYDGIDPESGAAWPPLPPIFAHLAGIAAEQAGYPGFVPDACLINRYAPGTRLTLHQDKDERDFAHPIVSVSLGLPARFQFGGPRRSDRPLLVPLFHGDVVVWGGPARLFYHGVLPLRQGVHRATGACRINLTLRRASAP
jgi:DNA oxidative demethylase